MTLFKMGVLKGMALAALAAVALAAGTRADAATLNFSLTGDYTANWQLDSDPTPTGSSNIDGYTFFANVPGVDPLYVVFYSSTLGFASGGVRISTTPDPLTEVGSTFDLAGDQIYTGLLSAPHFAAGTYNLTYDYITNAATVTSTTLKITAVAVATAPIPAALPLFMTGLLGLGFAHWRRRRAAPNA